VQAAPTAPLAAVCSSSTHEHLKSLIDSDDADPRVAHLRATRIEHGPGSWFVCLCGKTLLTRGARAA
jgi:hypothetical protein